MAITSGFFDSVEKDRLYNASQLSECFSGIVSDGVFRRVGDSFGVKIQPGTMKLTVGTGRALILGRWIKNDSGYTVTFSAADSSSDRIDSIAIGCDLTSRECSIYAVSYTHLTLPTIA